MITLELVEQWYTYTDDTGSYTLLIATQSEGESTLTAFDEDGVAVNPTFQMLEAIAGVTSLQTVVVVDGVEKERWINLDEYRYAIG